MLSLLISPHTKQLKNSHLYRYFGFFFLLYSLSIANAYSESFDSNELKLKTLYLYNFSKLTQWPSSTFETKTSPMKICIYGNKNYINSAQALSKKSIKKRSLEIQAISSPEQVINCHTLFISKNMKKTKYFLRQAYQYNVLTIGDNRKFIQQGGIISLIKINNKIRFEINLGAINKKQLNISSKLLRLAKTIHRKQILE